MCVCLWVCVCGCRASWSCCRRVAVERSGPVTDGSGAGTDQHYVVAAVIVLLRLTAKDKQPRTKKRANERVASTQDLMLPTSLLILEIK